MKTDVIIIGAGHAGLTMAAVLAEYGIKIALVDHAPFLPKAQKFQDFRTIALSLASKKLFEAIGIWENMAPGACPIHDIRVADQNSFFFVHFDHQEKGDQPMGWIIENSLLTRLLKGRVGTEKSVSIYDEAEIIAMETDHEGATISLKGGQKLEAQLLIAADGKNSMSRDKMGIEVSHYAYHQKAIICSFKHTKPHHHYAIEHFYPSGPFALLPLTDNRMSVVWTEPAAVVDDYMKLSEEEILGHLAQKIKMDLGQIELVTPFQSFPLSLSFALEYTKPSFALIGDAAHGIHPLSGQGFNLGVRDIAVLAEKIIEAKRLGLPIGSETVLSQYQQCRRFDNGKMIFATDFLNRLFGMQNRFIRQVRNLGFWGVERSGKAKNFFMNQAMGEAGEIPLLLQGKSL